MEDNFHLEFRRHHSIFHLKVDIILMVSSLYRSHSFSFNLAFEIPFHESFFIHQAENFQSEMYYLYCPDYL